MGQPLRIESVELPDPGPTDVVVRQFASGVCHSQLHEIHTPRASDVVLGTSPPARWWRWAPR